MKISRRAVFFILLILLLFITGILFRSFILENFVKPIALLIWVVRRLFASIDQAVYWIGLILAVLFINLFRIARQPVNLETNHKVGGNAMLENVEYWRTMILLASDKMDQPNYLRKYLRDLLKDVYSSKQPNVVPWEIYEAFDRGDIPLPKQVRNFLMLVNDQDARPSFIQRLQRISHAPGKWVRHWTGQDVADYYASIEAMIFFIEKQLENEDDK